MIEYKALIHGRKKYNIRNISQLEGGGVGVVAVAVAVMAEDAAVAAAETRDENAEAALMVADPTALTALSIKIL